jgi:hypothetical protein
VSRLSYRCCLRTLTVLCVLVSFGSSVMSTKVKISSGNGTPFSMVPEHSQAGIIFLLALAHKGGYLLLFDRLTGRVEHLTP